MMSEQSAETFADFLQSACYNSTHRLSSRNSSELIDPSIHVIVVRILELIIDLVAPIVNFYFLFLLRKKVFHTHLRVILGMFAVTLSIMTTTRSIDVINQLVHYPLPPSVIGVVNFAHNDCMTLIMDISLLLTLERLIATILANRYEKMRSIAASLLGCVILWTVNTHNTYLMYIWLDKSNVGANCEIQFQHRYSTNIVINISAMFVLNVLSVTLFIALRGYNMRRYLYDYKNKLTRRFQISENIRTSRQILYILLINLVVNIYFFFVLYYVAFSQFANDTVLYFSQFFDLFAAIASVTYPTVLIYSQPRLRLHVRQQLARLFYELNNDQEAPIHTINNQPMMFQTSAQGSVYFSELQRAWNV